jgi:hypothetical protein
VKPEIPGYSGKPLATKLGLKPPLTLITIGAPAEYTSWLGALPDGVRILSKPRNDVEAAHIFVTKKEALQQELKALRKELRQSGFVWISWPKKSSKVPTDITEYTIRELALPLGFVDIKVCAVSDVWSGLKLVIRKDQRTA